MSMTKAEKRQQRIARRQRRRADENIPARDIDADGETAQHLLLATFPEVKIGDNPMKRIYNVAVSTALIMWALPLAQARSKPKDTSVALQAMEIFEKIDVTSGETADEKISCRLHG